MYAGIHNFQYVHILYLLYLDYTVCVYRCQRKHGTKHIAPWLKTLEDENQAIPLKVKAIRYDCFVLP